MTETPCTRCGDDILTKHPVGWMVVDVQSPLLDSEVTRNFLCAECMTGLGEYLVPELKGDPAWESGKDQLYASMEERRG